MEIANTMAAAQTGAIPAERIRQMRETANAFETVFLAEMLKHAGLGQSRESFGGGEGEGAFASMLADEQAAQMVRSGGIGLAEHILNNLIAREAGQ